MRADFDPATTGSGDFYRLLTAVVVPRPIAWVSTLSADGVANLAPHSFYTVASTEPPVVQFTSVGAKDTLRNVLATGEFVVNLAAEDQFAAVNDTATDFPPGLGEFAAVGIAPEPSATVAPPRVAGSPVAIECGLHDTVVIGNCTVVFGRVRHVAVAEEALDEDGRPVLGRLRPLSRLGGDEWGATSVVHDRRRIRYADWLGGRRTEG
ncbi:flavin reductase family protein [Streptomyces sp. UH6]|uniref:flavin reductase family protein n=1 Tax=Streptomyces sp. UH6 TaxID=2748379 RepID=UPI0015D4A913|nr:flavin reductase family protein [Streptomyces sp. UH6]NYV76899.1 flavin reductase family protein [Streptomyces sp. UH6]